MAKTKLRLNNFKYIKQIFFIFCDVNSSLHNIILISREADIYSLGYVKLRTDCKPD